MKTPTPAQYAAIKAKHPDYLLIFEVGHHYCAYHDDARVCSKLLSVPMADGEFGIPSTHLDSCLKSLTIHHRRKVAICRATPAR